MLAVSSLFYVQTIIVLYWSLNMKTKRRIDHSLIWASSECERERRREFDLWWSMMEENPSPSPSPRSGMSSPEAKLGLKVEDLWDIQEPQLTPSEKLNSCFESIPVSAFPPAPSSQGTLSPSVQSYIYVFCIKWFSCDQMIYALVHTTFQAFDVDCLYSNSLVLHNVYFSWWQQSWETTGFLLIHNWMFKGIHPLWLVW